MISGSGPFDVVAGGEDTHLVLENAQGQLSLWPVWRAVPRGWSPCFGPARYEACALRVTAGRR